MPDWKTFIGQQPWSAPHSRKTQYNEGDRITKAPVDSGGSPVWTTDRTKTAITKRHNPCGYWLKDYTPYVETATAEALVFEGAGIVYLAELTAVGYTITEQATHSLSGFVIGAGWDRVNSQFIVFEDDYTNINAHKIATDGTLVSTAVLVSSPAYAMQIYGFAIPETDKYYVSYADVVVEGTFPNEHENLYAYFWQFDSNGVLETSWTQLLKSIDYGVDHFQATLNPSAVIEAGGAYYLTVATSYYTYPGGVFENKYALFFCSIADGSFTEADIVSDYAVTIGPVASMDDSLYYELYDTAPSTYTGLYTSTFVAPETPSFIVDLLKDPSLYIPYFSTTLSILGVYVSDEGKVVEVSTGTILYQITEISVPYTSLALARTLITA